jgi:hypothetical protein
LGYSFWKAPSKPGKRTERSLWKLPARGLPKRCPRYNRAHVRPLSQVRQLLCIIQQHRALQRECDLASGAVEQAHPRSLSSALICKVTAGCVRKSCSAALRKFRCSATARNTILFPASFLQKRGPVQHDIRSAQGDVRLSWFEGSVEEKGLDLTAASFACDCLDLAQCLYGGK